MATLRLSALTIAVALLARTPAIAQGAALPLQAGNYWAFDQILGNGSRWGAEEVGRIEITGTAEVLPVAERTVYWDVAADGAFGPGGLLCHTVALRGRTGLFFVGGIDTILVRADADDNLWLHGYVDAGIGVVLAEPEPWWQMTGGSSWNLRIDDTRWAIGYERFPFDRVTGGPARGVQSLLEHLGLPVEDLVPAIRILQGTLNGRLSITSGGSVVSSFVLPGFGPVWTYLPTDMAELRGLHLELTEARVDGRTYVRTPTAVDAAGWADLKAATGRR